MPRINDRKILELDKVLELLAAQAGCEDSRTLCRGLTPAGELLKVQRLLGQTADASSLSARYGTPSVTGMHNCDNSIYKASVGGRLAPIDLLQIAAILRTVRTLSDWKRQSSERETSLDELFSLLTPQRSLENRITDAIVSEDELSDTASPTLGDIRRKIRNAGLKIRDQLDKLIRSSTYSKFLQEQIVTQRDGRFVVPVKAECRGEIKGLIHDTSSSGATVFIEPAGVVEANNEIRVLQHEEQKEIDRILTELSASVGELSEMIKTSYDAAVELDVIFAKSRLADRMKASLPLVGEDGVIDLKKARHPLIDPAKVVPVGIRLGQEFDTLVITGPNTGGKTVALKTIGLLTLMAECGLMLPCADGSRVSVFRHVLADIGDEQSIEQSLSTFSGHIRNIISILEEADDRSLVLMDELGAGTDPVEGAALAIAIIEQLRARGARIAATTHYAEIKMYALEEDGVENGSCEFDVETLSPTYRLLIGVPGRSNAFAISARLGLENGIIDRAKLLVSTENTRFEDVVSALEASRQELEREKSETRRLRAEAEELRHSAETEREKLRLRMEKELTSAKEEARGIVERTRSQADLLILELELLKHDKDKEEFSKLAGGAISGYKGSMTRLHETASPVTGPRDDDYVLPRKLRRGDNVLITELGTEGVVLSGPDNSGNYTIQAGIIKTKVAEKGLRLMGSGPQKPQTTPQRKGSGKSQIASKATREVRMELDIRGYASDEGIIEVDRFIDQALLSGIKTITIIHGKGTGVLRAAVQSHLRRSSAVHTFRSGVYGEGEAGVTVVELK